MCRWWAPLRPVWCCAIGSRCESRREHGLQQRGRTILVERFVTVAALRRLHARRATALTRAPTDDLERGTEMPIGGREPEPGDAGTAGIAVVHEDRRRVGVFVVGDRDAADVPSITDR